MSGATTACLDDGTLLALLDGELDPAAARAAREHLDGCPACRRRLEGLRRRDEAVRGWIRRHDPVPPPRGAYDLRPRDGGDRRWSREWVAAAAVVVVSAGVLVSPARGLLGDRVREWLSALPFVREAPEAVPLEPVDAPLGRGEPGTAFAWAGPGLTLTFESPETVGRVTVEPAPDSLVTLWTPGSRIDLTVRPGRVDVHNAATPAGDYRLALPSTVSRLHLRVREGAESIVPVEGLTAPRFVPLPGVSPSRGHSP